MNESKFFGATSRDRFVAGRIGVVLLSSALVALFGCSADHSSDGAAGTSAGGSDGGQSGSGGTSNSEAGPPPTAAAACEAWATARCTRSEGCDGEMFFRRYADTSGCREFQTRACLATWFAPGSNFTPTEMQDCTAALVAEPGCSDSTLDACRPGPGKRGLGEICASGAQCQTGTCRGGLYGCGSCGLPAKAGEDCSQAPCEEGFECVGWYEFTCMKINKLGDGCSDQHGCDHNLGCKLNVCVAVGGLGEPCTADAYPDCVDSAACNTVTGKCELVHATAAEGEPCGPLDSGGYDVCKRGLLCNDYVHGTCVPGAKVGQPCEDNTSPYNARCAYELSCIQGKCFEEITATCP